MRENTVKIGNLEVYGIIYKITNNTNGKVYIGQTTNTKGIRGRYRIGRKTKIIVGIYNFHLGLSRNCRKGCNYHLLRSIEKYGFVNFKVNEVFDIAFSKEELDIKEKTYIALFKSTDDNYGYNTQFGGVGGGNNKKCIHKIKMTQIKNGNTRYVNQLDFPSLRVIRTFPSIASATKELGLSRSAIKNVLQTKYKSSYTAGGFAWEYIDTPNPKYDNIIKQKNENIDEEVIRMYQQYKSQKEIIETLNISTHRLLKILENNNIEKHESISVFRAKVCRQKILKLYLAGKRKCEIQKELGLTKAVVEKAIDKYKKKVIDSNGEFLNKKKEKEVV